MKLANCLIITICCVFLLIITIALPIESKRLIYRRAGYDREMELGVTHTTNIIAAPIIHCKKGYRLDSRKKCRKVFHF